MYVFNALRKSWTRIKPSGAFFAKALKDLAMSSGGYSTWILRVMTPQNSEKSISPFPSKSISLTIVSNSDCSMCSPTVSSNISNSSTEMFPDSSHCTREMSSSLGSLDRCLHSCLNRQKICRNSSMSSPVKPCFFLGPSSFFFGGGNFSAAFKARSNSFKLTSPPPSLSVFTMMTSKSASLTSSPSMRSPSRNSSRSKVPSPLASSLLKRSLARMRFFFNNIASCRKLSSASTSVAIAGGGEASRPTS
mmetsp:Transcript_70207/g.196791  ORF Transcript_70207/g.196791 Transcript_70207/m.196791 type:complete len:248 (+) Transcript_70207:301-1044(+)